MTDSTFRLSDARLLSVLDATLLDDAATAADIEALVARVRGKGVAAICVQGPWIATVRAALAEDPTPIATVVNFPHGEGGPWEAGEEAARWAKAGADEIDVVVPIDTLHRDGGEAIRWTVEAVRQAAPGCVVKAILETGALEDARAIRKAAGAAAIAGADFLKTSTGRHPVGATPEAVEALLDVMRAFPGRVGLKISGGVSSPAMAAQYWQQTERVMGPQWCHRKRFRIGASGLLSSVLPPS